MVQIGICGDTRERIQKVVLKDVMICDLMPSGSFCLVSVAKTGKGWCKLLL